MSLKRLCDYCGKDILDGLFDNKGRPTRSLPVGLVAPSKAVHEYVPMRQNETDLCDWTCVVGYAMRMGGIDPHGTDSA